MIKFSCEHCGQRMKITEDDGSKKAKCPKCGKVVAIVGGKPGRRGRSISQSGSGERTAALPASAPEIKTGPERVAAAAPVETGSSPPIHEIPTRGENVDPDRNLTSFLSPAQATDEIGRLGRYRVLAVVGAGGMGVVFKAEDPLLCRLVALKAMLPALAASDKARTRFSREAQAAAGIQHDHIVTVYDVGEANGIPYLAMPFLKGESLDHRLRRLRGPCPLPEVLRIGQQISEGLQAIHDLGLIHRDIKPGNVWLEGDAGRVKILDFGLARATSDDAQLTQEGAIVGSPAFMAPEQANKKPIDARTDLFSLGCVLYLMATGRLPFEGDGVMATLVAVACTDPPPPHECNPLIPPAVSQLILSLLAKTPADRPESAKAVVEAIRQLSP